VLPVFTALQVDPNLLVHAHAASLALQYAAHAHTAYTAHALGGEIADPVAMAEIPVATSEVPVISAAEQMDVVHGELDGMVGGVAEDESGPPGVGVEGTLALGGPHPQSVGLELGSRGEGWNSVV
jgi:hypothetical protein